MCNIVTIVDCANGVIFLCFDYTCGFIIHLYLSNAGSLVSMITS